MNNSHLTPDQARAARLALGVSQNFISRETGINRSQLALFEVGKYVLEPYKLMALQDCYERLGYSFDEADTLPGRDAEIPQPTPATQPFIEDDWEQMAAKEIAQEIAANDAQIEELAKARVKLHLWDLEPIMTERDAILKIMARNYQLMCKLQHDALFPCPSADEKLTPKTAFDLVAQALADLDRSTQTASSQS